MHDGERTQGHVASSLSGGDGSRVCAEVSTEGTPGTAKITVLTGTATIVRLRQIRGSRYDYVSAGEVGVDAFLEVFLHAVEFHGRQEFAVRNLGKSVAVAAYPNEFLHV